MKFLISIAQLVEFLPDLEALWRAINKLIQDAKAKRTVKKPIGAVVRKISLPTKKPVVKRGSPQPLQPSEDPKVEATLQQIIKENS